MNHRCTEDFTMDGVHRDGSRKFSNGARVRRSGGWKSASGVLGQSQEAEAKCEISVQFLTFSTEKLGCNEYEQYTSANTQLKKLQTFNGDTTEMLQYTAASNHMQYY